MHGMYNIQFQKTVFTSQTHPLLLYLMYYSGNMFRLAVESSSKYRSLIYSKCVMGSQTLTYFVLVHIMLYKAWKCLGSHNTVRV